MARRVLGGSELKLILEDLPTEDFRRLFKKNMPASANILRKRALRQIKRRLGRGVKGQSYDRKYARKKSKMKLRNYTTDGPVDLEFSGQLKQALKSRAKVDKGKGIIDLRLEFDPNSRKSFKRSPNANPSRTREISNKRLAEILNSRTSRGKVGPNGPPIALHESEADAAVAETAKRLIKG